MIAFHFLRPSWLWAFLPLTLLAWSVLKQRTQYDAWLKIADAHLLKALVLQRTPRHQYLAVSLLTGSIFFMIIALAGPTWSKNSVPTYQHIKPHVILLDLSAAMLAQDISPDRLSRAKFKIHDILRQADQGQFGLIAYTSEPFVVSPLTDDAQTIDGLLDALTPDIMPVSGQRLDRALEEAQHMLDKMGLQNADILVLSATPPSPRAIRMARNLARQGFYVSLLPVVKDASSAVFAPLATAGQGCLLHFTDTAADIKKWLALRHSKATYQRNKQDGVPLWRDEGRLFLWPALLLLLPIFRQGWLARIGL